MHSCYGYDESSPASSAMTPAVAMACYLCRSSPRIPHFHTYIAHTLHTCNVFRRRRLLTWQVKHLEKKNAQLQAAARSASAAGSAAGAPQPPAPLSAADIAWHQGQVTIARQEAEATVQAAKEEAERRVAHMQEVNRQQVRKRWRHLEVFFPGHLLLWTQTAVRAAKEEAERHAAHMKEVHRQQVRPHRLRSSYLIDSAI